MQNPIIRMMRYQDGKLSGKVVLNGAEWLVAPFQIKSGASATEKENALIERAVTLSDVELIKAREADKQKLISVNLGEL